MPTNFDAATQYQGRPKYVGEEIKDVLKHFRNLNIQVGRDKFGNLKFKKNAKGKYLDKDGNPIQLPNTTNRQYIREPFVEPPGVNPRSNPRVRQDLEDAHNAAENQKEKEFNDRLGNEGFERKRLWNAQSGFFPEPDEQYNKRITNLLEKAGAQTFEEPKPRPRFPVEDLVEDLAPEERTAAGEAEKLRRDADYKFKSDSAHTRLGNLLNPGEVANEISADASRLIPDRQRIFKDLMEKANEDYQDLLDSKVNPQFLTSGGWGGGTHSTLVRQAREKSSKDLQRNIRDWAGKDLSQANSEAFKIADMKNQNILNRENIEQNKFRQRVGAQQLLSQVGATKRQLGQTKKDTAHREFRADVEYPYKNLEREANLLQGYQNMVPYETTSINNPGSYAVNNPSNHSVNAGLLFQGAGMLGRAQNQGGGFAKGGSVEKYAPGGQPSYSGPMQRPKMIDLVSSKVQQNHPMSKGLFDNLDLESNRPNPTDAELPSMNSPELNHIRQHAQNLEKKTETPFWDALGAFGAGMKGRNANEMIQSGQGKAWDAFNDSYKSRDARENKIIDLNAAIQKTRDLQFQRTMDVRSKNDRIKIDMIKANAADKRASNAEARGDRSLDLNERRLDQDRDIAELRYNQENNKKENPSISIDGKNFIPNQALKFTPADTNQIGKIEEEVQALEKKKQIYNDLKQHTKEHKGVFPTTPIGRGIYNWTPNISDFSRKHARNLTAAVTNEVPKGPLTRDKRLFAERAKPTEADTPEAVIDFSEHGERVVNEALEPKLLARKYAAYNIPPRITYGAYEAWVNNNKEGNFEDYLSAILEGKPVGKSSSSHDMPSNDLSSLETENAALEEKLKSLK